MKTTKLIGLVTGIALAPLVAHADGPSPVAPDAAKPPSADFPNFGLSGARGMTPPMMPGEGKSLGAGLGFGQIGDDYYARVNLGFELNLGQIGFGIQAPMNLLVYEGEGPGKFPMDMTHATSSRDQKAYGGVLRRADYDEISDYGKIIRYVRWGHKGDLLYVLAGELGGANLGHSTLVSRYVNNSSLDHAKFGLQLDVNTDWGGVETVFDNIVSGADNDKSYGGENAGLIGVRGYARPLNGTGIPLLRRMAVGVTSVVDRRAPIVLARKAPGPGQTSGDFSRDAEGNFIKDGTSVDDSFKALGFDLEVPVLEMDILSVVPYIDYNMFLDVQNALVRPGATPMPGVTLPGQAPSGSGLHIGTLVGFKFPILLDISMSARLEYRYLGANYLPAYFDSQYEIQRFQYPLYADPTRCSALGGSFDAKQSYCYVPKAAAIGQLSEAKNGIYGELAFKFMNLLTVGGGVEDYEGPLNGAINLYATMPAFKDFLQITGFYSRRAVDITQEAFELDERSMLGASGRVSLGGGLWLTGMYTRQWTATGTGGTLQTVDNYNFGVDYALPL